MTEQDFKLALIDAFERIYALEKRVHELETQGTTVRVIIE